MNFLYSLQFCCVLWLFLCWCRLCESEGVHKETFQNRETVAHWPYLQSPSSCQLSEEWSFGNRRAEVRRRAAMSRQAAQRLALRRGKDDPGTRHNGWVEMSGDEWRWVASCDVKMCLASQGIARFLAVQFLAWTMTHRIFMCTICQLQVLRKDRLWTKRHGTRKQ